MREIADFFHVRYAAITPADKGALDPYTGTSQTSKIKRVLDRPDGDSGPSCADLVRDLAGSVKSGRRDLATKKELLQSAMEADFRRGRKRRR